MTAGDEPTRDLNAANTEAATPKPTFATRRYVGAPRLTDPVEALMLLVAFASFILLMIAYAAPEWKTFASPTGDRYTIGLWSACRNGVCTYAWSSYTPMVSVNPMTGRLQPVLYYQDATPSLIITAQVFIMMGLIWHLFATCCWIEGPALASLSLLFPAIFYTVGMSTGTAFFNDAQANYKGNPENILNLSWGYAVQCGFAGTIMMWIACVVFAIVAAINRNKPREVVVVQEQYYVMNEAA